MTNNPAVFSELYCKTIEAGENAGALEKSLRNMADYMEKAVNAKKRIKSALTYPLLITGVAIVVVFVLIYFVFPAFGGLYTALGAEPPLTMQLIMSMSIWLKKYWYYPINMEEAYLV